MKPRNFMRTPLGLVLSSSRPLRLTLIFLISLCFQNPLWAQLSIKGDVFIAQGGHMHVDFPKTLFLSGVVLAERATGERYGLISFGANSTTERADHNTHVNGFVRSHNRKDFVYPIGHDNILQPVHFSSEDPKTILDFAYSHVPHTNLSAGENIEKVSDDFYWTVHGNGSVKLSLSWNALSDMDKLTDNRLERLAMAGFDGNRWQLIPAALDQTAIIGGSSNLISGSITSKENIDIKAYKAFTLAAAKSDTGGGGSAAEAPKASQGFTPNGDGVNDTWHIDYIDLYPNAKIAVFSRWQRLVFESTGNYNNNWNGSFEGNPLPSAPYFYTIDLDADGHVDQSGWIYITR